MTRKKDVVHLGPTNQPAQLCFINRTLKRANVGGSGGEAVSEAVVRKWRGKLEGGAERGGESEVVGVAARP